MSIETAKIIKSRLKILGKKQAWLAERVGVSVNAVSKWTKDGKVARANAAAVAEALEITVDQLLAAAEALALVEPGRTTLERLNEEERELIELHRSSTREGQLFIRSAAKAAEKIPMQSVRRPTN